MAAPLLRLRVVGQPPKIEFTRETDVPDDLWFSIGLRLASNAHGERAGGRLEVAVERFLAERRWLAHECASFQVGIDFDDSVRALLARAAAEQEKVKQLLAHGADAIDAVPSIGADGSRFKRELRSFQERDLAKVLHLEHGANFSVPGAGKTSVLYAVYEAERVAGNVVQLLVVAPLSAFDAWEVEAEECFTDPPLIHRFSGGHIPAETEVLLVNYHRLPNNYEQLANWIQKVPTHLVLDEAHRMKSGRNGEWGSACLDLALLAERRDILTGTPAPQSARDFIALIDFLWPNQARKILPPDALRSTPPDGAMARVNQRIHPLFVRTTKRELKLPPLETWVERVEMGALQREIYDALRSRYAGMFALDRANQTMFSQMGEVVIYLLQAASNPALLADRAAGRSAVELRYPSLEIPPSSTLAQLVADYMAHEIPPKFQKLGVIVKANADAGRKTLVWSNFPNNLLELENRLARYRPALIYGGIPSDDGTLPPGTRTREVELDRFRNDDDCRILLANPAAMAEGISLHTACHDAIYLDRTFNAGQYLQSLDRIHRLGLAPETNTRVTFLVSEDTVDERVNDRVAYKAQKLAEMLNDPDLVEMSLPDEDDYGEAIEDVGDLETLFEHLSGH